MQRAEYRIGFLTPAFLGNAEQGAQWRTPPFKALLRQWWRVAVAREYGYDYRKVRDAEGRLFGHAWLSEDQDSRGRIVGARASKVRLRLESWSCAASAQWPRRFQEVQTTPGGAQLRSDLYLGYGPIQPGRERSAISTHDEVVLRLASLASNSEWHQVEDAVQLMHWFGTLGSRSRNGWGSLQIHSNVQPADQMAGCDLMGRVTRSLKDCLASDWPHAIGSDERGVLVWISKEPVHTWQGAVAFFAERLVQMRRVAKDYQPAGPGGGIQGIHLLGYPSGGRWQLSCWGRDSRLASPLRFKVVQWRYNRLHALVYHCPCDVPKHLKKELGERDKGWLRQNQESVWKQLHAALDGTTSGLRRVDQSK